MPANSCISISNSPPLIAVAIKRESKTNSVVSKSRSFSINWINYTPIKSQNIILKLSKGTSKNGLDKLKAFNIPYKLIQRIPVLIQAQAFVLCTVKGIEKTGDHDLFIASPSYAEASTDFAEDQYWRFKKYRPALYVGSIRANPVVTIGPPHYK